MKLKIIIIVLSLFCFPIISQNIKQDSCQLFFKEIGIRDFTLGSNYSEFKKESKLAERNFKKEDVYGIEIVTFSENIILLKEKKTVEYNLKFKNNILIDYTFRVNIGNYKKSMAYYEKVLVLLSKNKNKNNFIKNGRINNMETNKICEKFFRLVPNDSNYLEECFYGSISFTDPKLWEQQMFEYIKSIEKGKN
ncbi:hypothetical protein BC749_103295 [Flavobacterium araucananum]|uniref:Uncharacterized protein n=1 Tax=Flavobacterium araucananum TaxID=946678 RepID=A0A227NGZ2_9FLAO|nr:hypothetical protein [Flavobacterium araucananum]OXE96309.1 hypothetical protein B0A64_24000 [Flavobacterium araucananum]PWJ99914.1 hypothetical protein BC749_103295 [Flavobacterium araucananum]